MNLFGFESYPMMDADPLRLWRSWGENKTSVEELAATLPWEHHTLQTPAGPVLAPRLECWFSNTDRPYVYSGETYHQHPMPFVLREILEDVQAVTGHAFNAVFANMYRAGDDSIGWHADDEPALGPARSVVIASLSYGSPRRFSMKHRATGTRVALDLGRGDLLLMGRGCQSAWLHQVPKTKRPVSTRINLTFRRIVE